MVLRPFSVVGAAVAVLFFSCCAPATVSASEEFKKNNPDIRKFEFARSYISALSYIGKIDARWKKTSPKKVYAGDDVKVMRGYVAYLVKDNMDLRIAKNFLGPYLQAQNHLIRKTSDTFIAACLTLIAINDREKETWDQWYAVKSNQLDTRRNERAFVRAQQEMDYKRKEAYKDMVTASVLLTKVLRSDRNTGEHGHVLALTAKQRGTLLDNLDAFGKATMAWGMKPGQTSLQASIAVIREVLEDTVFTTLDDE